MAHFNVSIDRPGFLRKHLKTRMNNIKLGLKKGMVDIIEAKVKENKQDVNIDKPKDGLKGKITLITTDPKAHEMNKKAVDDVLEKVRLGVEIPLDEPTANAQDDADL